MSVLDTDMLVGLIRKDADALEKLLELAGKGDAVKTTVVNACELYKGAFLSNDPSREHQRVDELVRNMGHISLSMELAPAIGQISAEMERAGTPIGDFDIMIAVMTTEAGETLITRNVKHFERIPGVSVETW
ncbi:MAG: type II toxin-antitoxin system VapC family toxin [Thermoplasmata archaeon]